MAEHLWRAAHGGGWAPLGTGVRSQGPRILVCWFETVVRGGGCIFRACVPQAGGDVEPVAKVDGVALEKRGRRISCW